MKLKKILTGLRSTAVRQNPRPLGREASLTIKAEFTALKEELIFSY
jgi:hypothetical protein